MNPTIVIHLVKYVTALTIGVTVGAVTRPAVKTFFKLDNQKKKPETIPSEDIEEEEAEDEE